MIKKVDHLLAYDDFKGTVNNLSTVSVLLSEECYSFLTARQHSLISDIQGECLLNQSQQKQVDKSNDSEKNNRQNN